MVAVGAGETKLILQRAGAPSSAVGMRRAGDEGQVRRSRYAAALWGGENMRMTTNVACIIVAFCLFFWADRLQEKHRKGVIGGVWLTEKGQRKKIDNCNGIALKRTTERHVPECRHR